MAKYELTDVNIMNPMEIIEYTRNALRKEYLEGVIDAEHTFYTDEALDLLSECNETGNNKSLIKLSLKYLDLVNDHYDLCGPAGGE